MPIHVHVPVDPQQSCVYPDWVRRVPAPDSAASAEQTARAEELIARVREWCARPKHPERYFTEPEEWAAALPPEHLPWFWDNVGHLLLPRWQATGAYRRARQAEREYALAVDVDYCIGNTLLYTRYRGLKGEEMVCYYQRLQEELKPRRTHREFARFLQLWAHHNHLAPADDLHELVRASAEAAGLGLEEDSRLLGELLIADCGWRAAESLLQGAARVFAQVPPDEPVQRGLLAVFTRTQTRTNGKGLLQVLRSSGALAAMCAGRIVPEGGCAGWLSRFVYHYSYYFALRKGTVRSQPMPPELYAALPALAARIREEGVPVRLHESRYQHPKLDAQLADACLALGIPVADPGSGVPLHVPPRRKRTFPALLRDPVLGPRVKDCDLRPKAISPLA